MGDQLGDIVEGELVYISAQNAHEVLTIHEVHLRAKLFADLIRLNALYMIARAGSGHIGSSFSSAEIFAWLYLNEIDGNSTFFSSKGHDAPSLYATLIALGRIDEEFLHKLRRIGGLPGHPDVTFSGVSANTGSLGMGISKAKGMIRAHRIRGEEHRVFVLTGDGELQEGQIWESLVSAANEKLHELTVLVDHNKLQSDTFVSQVSALGNLDVKFQSFGWDVQRIDGHDTDQLAHALARKSNLPRVIICDTVKGRGVSFMEHTAIAEGDRWYRFHSGAPTRSDYQRASHEIWTRIQRAMRNSGLVPPELSRFVSSPPSSAGSGYVHRLIDAYSEQLLESGTSSDRLVVLDADLVKDTGVVAFAEKFPSRFIECGIAEQDMVSQASGLALQGMLPVVHSFACFLSARPNEQIYNAATERKKIIYVGSLAGVVPGGPGHSHQGVRDLAALSGIPNLVVLQPATEGETRDALKFAIKDLERSYYIRLVSVPTRYEVEPLTEALQIGRGYTALGGDTRVTIVTAGPTLLSQAMSSSLQLKSQGSPQPRVVNMPFLNRVDREWLSQLCDGCETMIVLDDHYEDGGLGRRLCAEIAIMGLKTVPVVRAIETIPAFGSTDEVLRHHGFDVDAVSQLVRRYL